MCSKIKHHSMFNEMKLVLESRKAKGTESIS